jgi:uncharacterized protein (TIGR03032 family)
VKELSGHTGGAAAESRADENLRARNDGGVFPSRRPEGRSDHRISLKASFSRGFGEWLARNGVSLICSTYQTGHLISVGVRSNGKPAVSAAGFHRVMGIYANSQRIYAAVANGIWHLENILAPHETANDIYDRLYVPRNTQWTGDLDIHELAVELSGRIIFVNTKYSCLAALSTTNSFRPIWKPKFISRLAPEDRCHLNGLAMEEGRVHYVTACSAADAVDGWRDNRQSGGVLIDVDTDEIILDCLSMPHSPRVVGEFVYLLESGRGALVRLDRRTGGRVDVAILPGFLRGLAIHGGYAAVTVSLPRKNSSFQALSIAQLMKERNAPEWCGVQIVDLRNGDIVQWMRFDESIAELFNVVFLPGVRCPRALGPEAADVPELVRFDPLG